MLSRGVPGRLATSGGKRTVTRGPFGEPRQLIAGFWLWQAGSMEEAIEWVKRAPFDGDAEIEVRRVYEAEDFGAAFTPELKAQEDRQRAQVAARKQSPRDEAAMAR